MPSFGTALLEAGRRGCHRLDVAPPEVTGAIVGGLSPAQIEGVISVMGFCLSEDEIRQIETFRP